MHVDPGQPDLARVADGDLDRFRFLPQPPEMGCSQARCHRFNRVVKAGSHDLPLEAAIRPLEGVQPMTHVVKLAATDRVPCRIAVVSDRCQLVAGDEPSLGRCRQS